MAKQLNELSALKQLSALDIINKLRVVEFDWKHDNVHEVGLIAVEVEKIFPEAVVRNTQGQVEGLKFLPLIALLVKGVKELKELQELQELSQNTERR